MVGVDVEVVDLESNKNEKQDNSQPQVKLKHRASRKRSGVWVHFEDFTDENGVTKSKCKHCGNEYTTPTQNGTSTLGTHLKQCEYVRIFYKSSTSALSTSSSILGKLSSYNDTESKSTIRSKLREKFKMEMKGTIDSKSESERFLKEGVESLICTRDWVLIGPDQDVEEDWELIQEIDEGLRKCSISKKDQR